MSSVDQALMVYILKPQSLLEIIVHMSFNVHFSISLKIKMENFGTFCVDKLSRMLKIERFSGVTFAKMGKKIVKFEKVSPLKVYTGSFGSFNLFQ